MTSSEYFLDAPTQFPSVPHIHTASTPSPVTQFSHTLLSRPTFLSLSCDAIQPDQSQTVPDPARGHACTRKCTQTDRAPLAGSTGTSTGKSDSARPPEGVKASLLMPTAPTRTTREMRKRAHRQSLLPRLCLATVVSTRHPKTSLNWPVQATILSSPKASSGCVLGETVCITSSWPLPASLLKASVVAVAAKASGVLKSRLDPPEAEGGLRQWAASTVSLNNYYYYFR
ncbi:unnamed protein product [Protopolystoma xenopodis]|uniref:Uncharacterized protein n=1 Tax=Protopolystoma xenopodis TaxID=117903 RepID=A0A3S5A208_9PLAT|nr:unnamed protein product [Protopolystoma xenopodis]